jgi:hypothetical protein
VQQHRQRDFSDKTGPADEEDLFALKYFVGESFIT